MFNSGRTFVDLYNNREDKKKRIKTLKEQTSAK